MERSETSVIGEIQRRFRVHFHSWVNRRMPPLSQVLLDRHNIFIIPNQQGLAFCFVLALMFIGAINYEASLAFALVFLLIGMFLISIFHTFRNLAGLTLSGVTGKTAYAGERVEVTVILNRRGKRQHEAVQLSFPGSQSVMTDLIGTVEQRISLFVPTRKRGYFRPGRLTIETVFPFGICRAWSLPDLDLQCLVYPAPVACDVETLITNQHDVGKTNIRGGNDDFYGLREYQQGDSLRHVAWKNFARGQGMYTKQFSSNVDDKIWLDWEMFPGMEVEDRLSRLSYCVLQLDSGQLDYGLRLPDREINPGKGASHFSTVMQALALFGKGESAA